MSPWAPTPGAGPLAGFDPGRSKCGLVLTDGERQQVVAAGVLPPEEAGQLLDRWQCSAGLAAVVLGNGTGSALWQQRLEPGLLVLPVEERGSTLAARDRYWQLHPARGWRRLLPRGLRQPPRDWDDVVAQLLLERWLGRPLIRPQTLIALQKLARTVKA